ncbi:MAG: ECF-type sigma factor [Verrucomicrobia bacterium]|nr:ECF-type sigma factor [Verrucomicrobiota bacterium]
METEPLDGDPNAADQLLPPAYEELRRMAAHRMARERAGQTLQATALVHEVWLRLNDSNQQQRRGREHFLSAAAEFMHRILVERARRKSRVRCGGIVNCLTCPSPPTRPNPTARNPIAGVINQAGFPQFVVTFQTGCPFLSM